MVVPRGAAKKSPFALLVLCGLLSLHNNVARANEVEKFYRDKTIDLIVSSEVGGGYDAYARLISSYMEKHLPGHPRFVPKNMVGAGGVVATNYLANVAKTDGTVIASVQNTIPFQPLFSPTGLKFSAMELGYIGSANSEVSLSFVWHTSSTLDYPQLQQRETLMAGVNGSISAQYARAMNELAGAKIKLVVGYAGASQSMLAIERGEVEGYPAIFWSTLKATRRGWLEKKQIRLMAQMALRKHPDLPDVPLIFEFIQAPKDRAAAELLLAPQLGGRPFITGPGVPPERLAALRKAFDASLHDPDLLHDAAKRNLEVQYTSGAEISDVIAQAFKSPPDIVERVRKIYNP